VPYGNLRWYNGEAATFEKASNEAAEEFTRQSASLLSWNQMTAFMRGNHFGLDEKTLPDPDGLVTT
jgi:hypothetical protein